jgi:hypothetical protein
MTYETITATLPALLDGLYYISESESPFRYTTVTGDLPQPLAAASGLPVDDFHQGDATAWLDKTIRNAAADPADAPMLQLSKRYEALKHLLTTQLTDLRLYSAGKLQVQLFICGRMADGNWLVLHTTATQT